MSMRSLADLDPPLLLAENFLNFVHFFGKYRKIVCMLAPPGGWRPLLRGILDPPLEMIPQNTK